MRNTFILSLIVLTGIMTSCIEYVNMDSREEMPVVVNCVLTRDTVQTLRLYRMRVLSETMNAPIEDATVYLQGRDNNGKFQTVAEFHRTEGINWEAKFQPEYDTDYGLLIKVPGKEDITATTRFPEDLRLIQCCRFATFVTDTGMIGNYSKGYGMHTAEVRKGKYYTEWNWRKKENGEAFKAYIQVSENPCKIWAFSHVDTTYVSPGRDMLNLLNEDQFQFSGSKQPLSKYIATNHPGADRFNITPGRLADLNYWNRPDKVFDQNISQWCLYLCPDVPLFDGFVRIDHPGNFRNGLTEDDLKNSYYYSDRSFFIGGDYSDEHNAYAIKAMPFPPYYDIIDNRSFLNEVHFVSDEYDTYLRELYVKLQNSNDFILSSYDYNNVYSNINGGVGIFGADNITWDMEQTVSRIEHKGYLIWEDLCPGAPSETD